MQIVFSQTQRMPSDRESGRYRAYVVGRGRVWHSARVSCGLTGWGSSRAIALLAEVSTDTKKAANVRYVQKSSRQSDNHLEAS